MAIHKILLDDFFEEEHFTLIGIHCTIEDYRLAYLLNDCLKISLKRESLDIDNSNNTAFPIFEWEDHKQQIYWNLVSNSCKVDIENKGIQTDTLFHSLSSSSKVYYLVPEHKKVNYVLKICNALNSNKEKLILNKILTIPQIITAYSINVNTLKSKDNLIFN